MDFRQIYRRNAWNGFETRSGPGSSVFATANLADWLLEVVLDYGIESVLDAPCGEGKWMPELPGYVGMDLVTEAVAEALRWHPERQYFVGDARVDPLPNVDAIFTRDFMQHLSLTEGEQALDNFLRSSPKWLFASTYQDGENTGSRSYYDAYRVNLLLPPFNLPEPYSIFPDGFGEDGRHQDPNKVMAVWKLG